MIKEKNYKQTEGIYFAPDYWSIRIGEGIIDMWSLTTTPSETIEDKIKRMQMDKFKKDYPMFANIEDIIEKVKLNIKIYNNDIMNTIILKGVVH